MTPLQGFLSSSLPAAQCRHQQPDGATAIMAHHPYGPDAVIHHHQSSPSSAKRFEGPPTGVNHPNTSAAYLYHHRQAQRLQRASPSSNLSSDSMMKDGPRYAHHQPQQQQQGPAAYSHHSSYDQPDYCTTSEAMVEPAAAYPPPPLCLSTHTSNSNNSNTDTNGLEEHSWGRGHGWSFSSLQHTYMDYGPTTLEDGSLPSSPRHHHPQQRSISNGNLPSPALPETDKVEHPGIFLRI